MADAAVSFLLENLQQLIAGEAELLIGVKEKVGWIETEFRIMVAYLESIDALHQLPENSNDWVEKTRAVIRRAEDLIETYAKRASQSKTAAIYKKPIYWIEKRGLSKELGIIRDEIIQVRRGWRSVDFANSLKSRQDLASSSQDSGFAAMAKLDSALQFQYGVPLLDDIKWVRDELAPLHDFLQEIDHEQGVQVLGERQKIWVQELRDIFQFIDESFANFQGSRETGNKKGLFFFLSCLISYSDQFKLHEVVSEIQGKILQLYRRYYAYGFGEILVSNGSRSIFPRIRMTGPIRDVSRSAIAPVGLGSVMSLLSFMSTLPARQRQRRMTYSPWLTPRGPIELLRTDLKLMKALLEDTRAMGDLDERVKVWLNQMQEISVDLEALDEHASDISQGRKGVFYQVFGRMKIARKLRQIGNDIHDIAARKMTYGIGSALGEAGLLDSIAADSFEDQPYKLSVSHTILEEIVANLEEAVISKAELRRLAKSVGKELQLMQALLQDVNRMEKLDARLKVWVEEMQGIAREANAAVEFDRKSLYRRIRAARRIKQIHNHILIMSKWKHTYDIGDVKSRRHADHFIHDLEERGPYPSNAIEERLELIRREIKLMQALDVEMDELDGTSEAWVEEMRNTAKDAEKLISIFDTEEKVTMITFPYGKFASVLDRVKDKITQLSEIRIAYGIELRQRLPPHTVRQIKAKLLMDYGHPFIVPILGMRHKHKEALQDLINDDDSITHHFDWHAWVYVPEEYSATSISDMAKQIMEQHKAQFLEEELTSVLEGPTEEELMKLLQDILMRKRCLIVLDEIKTIEVWQRLKQAFQQISTGSRILLISNDHTCSLLNLTSNAIFDKSVILRQLPPESGDVMPVSDASNIVNLSVPSYLRQCLYYFLLFPANFEVPTRRLIVLWVAEGLVHSKKNENESVEHVAEHYLNELIDLGMVCVTKKKLSGKVKACQLNDGTRDTWLKIAKEARFFEGTTGNISRLVDHHGTSNSCFIQIHGNPSSSTSVPNYRNVLSFLSFDTQEGSKPGEDIGAFLNKCISAGCFLWLRMLDLERVFRPKLPKALSKLTLLRYLGLRWTYLENLPKYVSKLLNLQVLDVKHTYISILPRSIWSMQYLRHLYLSETYRTRFIGRPSDISLTDLQTLWGAFIDENTFVKEGLDTLLNIRKLGLSCRSSSSQLSLMAQQLEAVNEWISNLKFLESLRLKSRDERGKASDLHLKPLTRNQNLSTVYLLGKLHPSVVCEFPVNLIDITLSGSELDMDPMKYLEKLPELLILRLLSQSVVHRRMHCSKGGFPKLKVLRIWKLENLEEWEAEERALPSLEDLEIRSCENLKMLPDVLQEVNALQKFRLTSMPEGFINKTKGRQPELWAKIEHVIEVD
ncbi:hypothetical protein Pfo_026806 [Paulownia fortunei]|nr:hypothetical protein Pfo_026806 [Paulownia fortunei]